MASPDKYRIAYTFNLPAAGFARAWLDALACTSKSGFTVSSCVLLEFGNGDGLAVATADDLLFVGPLADLYPDLDTQPLWSGYIPDPDGIVTKLARSLRRSEQYLTVEIGQHKKDATAAQQLTIRATSGESISTHVALVNPVVWRQAFRHVNEAPVAVTPDYASYPMSAMTKLGKVFHAETLLIQPQSKLAAYRVTNEDGVRVGQGIMIAMTSVTAAPSFEGVASDTLHDVEEFLRSVAPPQQQLPVDAAPLDFPGGIDPAEGEALSLDDLIAADDGPLPDDPNGPVEP